MFKKWILGMLLLAIVSRQSMACDVCGCATGGFFLGTMPMFHKHYVGLRWRHQSFQSHLTPSLLDGSVNSTKEYFHTAELNGRFRPHERVQVVAFLPFSRNERVFDDHHETQHGMGDLSMMATYRLLGTKDSATHTWKYNIRAGGGFKAPTGGYQVDNSREATPNFQLGTGSWDALLILGTTVRWKAHGINFNVTHKRNSENRDQYRFGHRTVIEANVFTLRDLGKIVVMPSAGVIMESAQKDTDRGFLEAGTGGHAIMGTVSLDSYFNRYNLGVRWQSPLSQNLSNGAVKAADRWAMHFNFLF